MPESSKSSLKIVPLLIVAAVILPIGWFAGHHFLKMTFSQLFIKAPADKKFMDAWAADLEHLRKIHALPDGFKDLRAVKVASTSEKLKTCFKKYPIDFGVRPAGRYTLEIFMDEIDDGGIVVQYDLVDRKSGNTIWELGRTFPHRLK